MRKRTRDQISDSDDDGEGAVGSDKEELNIKPSPKRGKHTSDESNNSDDSDSSLRENRKENVKSNLFLEDLSSDDELLTIQIPSGFSTETLTNIKIDFNEVNQIKDKSGDVFNVRFLENQSKIVFALPSKKKNAGLKAVPLGGHIIIHKDVNIPDVNFNNDRDNDNDKIDFPTDLKVRHPLLGADWKDYVGKTNEELKERSPKKRRKVKT